MRSTDDETAGWVDEELGVCIYHLCRQNLIKYILLNVFMDLLLAYLIVMLGR